MKHLRLVLGLVGCVCLFNYVVDGFPKRIPLGGIFPRNLSAGVTAFRYEVEKHNNSTVAMDFKLDRYEKIVNEENSQDLTGKICTTLFKGIFAFYGVTSPSTIDTVASYSHTLHMPYVSSALPPTHTFQPSDYLFYMRPSYTQAMIGLIKYFKWSHVSYVYDDSEGLSRLLEVRSKLNIKISPTRLLGTENCYTALRKLDSQQKSGPKYIVLDLSSEEALRQVLRQILKVGMNRASYHYLLGVLAMDELDLKDFEHGGVNITGFRLVNPKNPQVIPVQQKWSQLSKSFWKGAGTPYLELDVAVAMDAVNVLVRSLSDMLFRDPNVFKGTFRRGQVYNNKTRGIHCFTDIPDPWRHGPSIAQSIRNVEYEGVTGRVAFDRHGHRRDFELEVMELTLNRKTERVGTWFSSNESLLIDMVDNSKDNTGQKTGNKTRIITSVVTPPYLMYKTKTDNNGDLPVGNDRFEGYCAELAKEIAKHCHFDYIIKPVADGKYGALLENGKWDGMVAELTNGVADLAIAPLTINSKRERVIDFSKPFMRLGISIMIKKPEKQKPGVFSFMDPLSKDIWGCIIVAYIGVSVVLFLVSRFSPYEWQIEDSVNGPSFTNDFTLLNSLWFSLGAFMRQGCDVSPRSLSGRIVGSVWWFFTLILISSYTANLAAFLTVERMLTPIESADDLAEQTEIQYGTLASGSTQDFFKTSKVAIYERMWNFMSSQEPSVFTKDTAEGVERVRNSKGKFAFLLESTMNEYHNQLQPCNTMKVGANLDNKGYGIATPLESDLRSEVNLAVLKLQENGFLPKLKKKWWIDKGECTAEAEGGSSSQSALTLSNVAGIFYILIGGLGLAMVVSLLEFLYKSKLETRRQKKALANSFRQKARMAARGTPEHENGGVGSRTSFPQYMSTMPITHSSDISLI